MHVQKKTHELFFKKYIFLSENILFIPKNSIQTDPMDPGDAKYITN